MCKWMLQLISLFLFRCLLHAHRQAKYDNGFFAPLLRHCTTIITIAIVSVSFSHTQTHRQTFRICTRTHFQIISFWIFSFSYKMSDRYSELKIYYFFPLRSEKCHNSIGCFYVIHRKMYWTFSTLCNWLKAFWCIQQLQIQLLERTLRLNFFLSLGSIKNSKLLAVDERSGNAIHKIRIYETIRSRSHTTTD